MAVLPQHARSPPYSGWCMSEIIVCHLLTRCYQYYLSSLLGFLIIEMVASWGAYTAVVVAAWLIHSRAAYYRYLNANGRGTTSTVFLIVGMSICTVTTVRVLTLCSCHIGCWTECFVILLAADRVIGAQCCPRVLGAYHAQMSTACRSPFRLRRYVRSRIVQSQVLKGPV